MQTPKTPRRKRPEPERTEPDRTWAASAPRAAQGNGAPAGADPAPADPANPRSSTYRALNDAYRLVDEYLRQGQKMAENIWLPQAGNGAPSFPSFGAPDRFMRAVGDMTLAWVEVMQQWTSARGTPQGPPTGSAGPFSAGVTSEPRASAPATSVTASPAPERELTVSVASKGRVSVSVQLAERVDLAALEATELRQASGKAPAIPVSLAVDDASAVLSVVVPDEQEKGTYHGLFIEKKSQKPRGTLSLVVA